MIYIDLSSKGLSTLDGYSIPTTVVRINLDNNNFTDLTSIPSHIKNLYINNNQSLTSLKGCPPGLLTLHASDCSLTTLDYLAVTTKICIVNNNAISDISHLLNCNELQKLHIDSNQLNTLEHAIYPREIYASNNNISTIATSINVSKLYIKRNPLSSITVPLPNLNEINLTGTNMTDLNIVSNTKIKMIKEDYNLNDYSIFSNIYEFNQVKERYSLSLEDRKKSYINIYYTNPSLHEIPPIFMTLPTTSTWTLFNFDSFFCDRYQFKQSGGIITYNGTYKKQFLINNYIIVSGAEDLVQIVGIKNKTPEVTISFDNSMIVSCPFSEINKSSLSLNSNFFLNTGDTISFYIRTMTNNTLTIYTMSLLITELVNDQNVE